VVLSNYILALSVHMEKIIHKHAVDLLPEAKLIIEKEFNIALLRIYDNQIFHIYFFSGGHITMSFIEEIYAFHRDFGPKIYKNLFEFESHVDLDPEVRVWASAPDGNKFTIADALVINNLAHRLLASFYLRYNKPIKPTRIFYNKDKALNWLLQQE